MAPRGSCIVNDRRVFGIEPRARARDVQVTPCRTRPAARQRYPQRHREMARRSLAYSISVGAARPTEGNKRRDRATDQGAEN